MFTVADIAAATGGTVEGDSSLRVSGVSTDSRKVAAGQLFVPLTGARFDGHDYICDCAAKGVKVFLVSRRFRAAGAGETFVRVDDTLRALGDLAACHRRRFPIPVVAVTGSNGKTTTKEMLAAIMAGTGPGLKTQGNLNNLIGLPLTLFGLGPEHRWAVLEMGMSEPGEIDRLAEIAAPDVGIVTNAFPAHLESMKTVENVARAKGELFLRLPPGGVAVYNAEDPLISALPVAPEVQRVGYGLERGDIRAERVVLSGMDGIAFTLRLPREEVPVRMRAFGRHNASNAAAAAAAALAVGVPSPLIAAGLQSFTPTAGRFAPEQAGSVTLVDDSYNANPASVAAALRTLKESAGEARRIAALGDMLELGEGAEQLHRETGAVAAACVDFLVAVGPLSRSTAEGAREAGLPAERILEAAHSEEAAMLLLPLLNGGEFVLVKGSRGMKMEKISEALRKGAPSAKGTR